MASMTAPGQLTGHLRATTGSSSQGNPACTASSARSTSFAVRRLHYRLSRRLPTNTPKSTILRCQHQAWRTPPDRPVMSANDAVASSPDERSEIRGLPLCAHIPACRFAHAGYRSYSCTSSGHGTIVDFTVFIAIASATALLTPSSENGYSVCISSQGYFPRVR